jgi:hypothetical protein
LATLAQDFGEKSSVFGQERKKAGDGREKQNTNERTDRVAALRAHRDGRRGGNDAPWKAWETPKAKNEFSTLSTGLGNPAKNNDAGFSHFHRAGGGVYQSLSEGEKKKS